MARPKQSGAVTLASAITFITALLGLANVIAAICKMLINK